MTRVLVVLMLTGQGYAVAGDVDASGSISSDFRMRLSDLPAGPWYAPVGKSAGISRSETILQGRVTTKGTDLVAVADAGIVVNGLGHDIDAVSHLSLREKVDPVTVEMNELYIEVWNVLLDGLDLRVGHQLVQWGVADQFNPTNNLNADDFEDSLQFGKQLPNTMIRADYALGAMWTASAVLVPIFRPAMLPNTSGIGLAALDRLPMVEEQVRWQIQTERLFSENNLGYPTVVTKADPRMPARSAENMQWMFRVGGSVGMQDVSASYYNGRSDIPQASRNYTSLVDGEICHPDNPNDCINGYLATEATLAFPRMQVFGFNAAGEVNALGWAGAEPFGWRAEVAVIKPERTVVTIDNGQLPLAEGLTQPAGEYNYGLDGERPTIIEGDVFAKWTLGVDYTVNKFLYLNGQWVHGMADEFGAGDFLRPGTVVRAGGADWEILRNRIGDYAVVGADILTGPATLRLFSVVDVTGYVKESGDTSGGARQVDEYSPFSKEGFSAVLYPELMFNMGTGLTASVGTIQMFGESYTKFGDLAAGGDLVFVRGRYQF